MKYHLFFFVLLSAIFFGGGYFDCYLMIQGKVPLLNTSHDIDKGGKIWRYRSPIYEAKVASEFMSPEELEGSDGMGVEQSETTSMTWEWKWLNFIIWLFLGLVLHRLLKRIPKGTVA